MSDSSLNQSPSAELPKESIFEGCCSARSKIVWQRLLKVSSGLIFFFGGVILILSIVFLAGTPKITDAYKGATID